jgi:hypothetical protein
MGLECIILYVVLMFVVGPVTVLYGVFIVVRRKVRLSAGRVHDGSAAAIAGTATMVIGFAFTFFLWYMAKFLPH